MSDTYKKVVPDEPADPGLSVWDNISKHFKSRKSVEPQQNVESNPQAMAEVSKSFKSAFK